MQQLQVYELSDSVSLNKDQLINKSNGKGKLSSMLVEVKTEVADILYSGESVHIMHVDVI